MDDDVARIQRSALDPHSTGNADALLAESKVFLPRVHQETVLGRTLQLGAVEVGPFVTVPWSSDVAHGEFVAEGQPLPAARLTFGAPVTAISKIGFIVALVQELVRARDPRALTLVEQTLIRTCRRTEDRLFLDDQAAVPQERPAGALFGLAPISGGSPANFADDWDMLWLSVREGDAERPVIIMAPRAAVHLATLTTLDGAPLFPNLGPLGGTIMGVPVLTTPAAGNKVILIDASCLIVTDEGLLIDRTEHASVELSDSPSSPSTLVSGFQGNLALLKVTRYLHWTFTAADAVAYLELTDLASSPA